MFVLQCTYYLFIFTDFVPDENTRYTMGWALIGTMIASALFNTVLMLFMQIKFLMYESKKKKAIKKVKKVVKMR